jgi:hypothetical protein
LGIVLIIVGLVVAVVGITGIARPENLREDARIVGDQNQPEREAASSMLLPVIAGLTLARGAFLVGVGMGNFKRPTIVPPDSPKASKAATTRGTTP